MEDIRPTENANRINARWTNDEILLAVQGVRKYGKDFQVSPATRMHLLRLRQTNYLFYTFCFILQAIAETLCTKTEAHVKTFYVNHRRRYNLDQIIKKHEADREASTTSSTPTTTVTSTTTSSASSNVTAALTNTVDTSNAAASVPVIKDETSLVLSQANKKKDVQNVNDESDNTTSSETAISKSTISTVTTSDERKSESGLSIANIQKDNVIMEVSCDIIVVFI